MTLTHRGEQALDSWLDSNAMVAWQTDPLPWRAEQRLITALSLPLNIQGNDDHPFYARLPDVNYILP